MQVVYHVSGSSFITRWPQRLMIALGVVLVGALGFTGCELFEDDGNKPGGQCVISDTVEREVVWGERCTSYLVTATVRIRAEVTVLPGTVLVFQSGTGFYVEENGSLNAVGLEDKGKQIVFKGERDEKGYWHGIAFHSNSSLNELSWVTVQDSGGSGYNFREYGVLVQGRLKVTDSVFRDSSSFGLYADDDADLRGFARNTFIDIDEFPLSITATQAGSLDTQSSYKDSKTKPFIALRTTKVTKDVELNPQDVPYRVQGNISIADGDGTFSIKPGVDLVFEERTRIEVSDGALSAVGTQDEPITMRGTDASASYWNGIAFRTNSSKNELKYVHLSDGGAPGYNFREYGILVIGRATLSHNIFSNIGSPAAIVVDNGASVAGFESNEFSGNAHYPLSIPPQNLGELDDQSDFVGSAGENNGKPWILVDGNGNVTTSQTWHKQNAAYRIKPAIKLSESSAIITIEPGAVFEFEESGRIDASAGALNAQGTNQEPIIFQGVDNSKGYWGGLYFGSNSSNNVLNYAVVSDAGGSGHNFNSYGVQVSGQLTLNNSTLKNNKTRALWIHKNATITPSTVANIQASNTFSGNDKDIEDAR